ncbi:glycoside hydrolase family 127 protein [Rubrobacter tropicus]|uniref:Glycoside hydrolase family 127 protein n=1 Tax=Rubrobacter tropicus TaxID=2653851 RepID=A0A6G8QAK2_9ACTN|nr:beta-L-arabinofuranosidase domain-containing protein [Rubrobacter tropicus]QIN83458.1 glycoside hydrolase family 127 protein [Rubrobacter tropicus]
MLDSTRRPVVVDTSKSPHARLRPLPLTDVRLSDGFWGPRRRANREETLPSQYRHLEETGRLDNFRKASGKMEGRFEGIYFNDSDVYKWLEAAAWSLATDPDPELTKMVDAAITEIEDAQEPDGYLNTYFTFERADKRWTNFDLHEMYCAGHLFQAAVAHFQATGSTRLLGVATRFADHICDTFGPEEEGKRRAVDGHEEVEMALVELFRVTGDRRYLEQAEFFVDARGRGLLGRPYGLHDPSYSQDHSPLREQDEVVGHAVRALYLYSGATDVYAETGEPELLKALRRLWNNMTTRRMYVSGGLGSRHEGEAFGEDFELPNGRAYTETCAAIGSVMWNWRMLVLEGDARYADLIEHTLYNAVLPGFSLDGGHYFYENPLEDEGTHRRQPWFGCACCPPNVARMLASIPGYFYSASDDAVWVHLYAEGSAEVRLNGGRAFRLGQRTNYPWEGDVEIQLDGEGEFAVMLRVPSWCEGGASIEVNGEPFPEQASPGAYAEVRRVWRPGDAVRLRLPMPVRRVEAHPYAAENVGRVALMRGPILFCVEGADNPGLDPRDLVLPNEVRLSEDFQPEQLGGVVVLAGEAEVSPPGEGWDGRLYRTATRQGEKPIGTTRLRAVPYLAWANREPGPMRVWIRSR